MCAINGIVDFSGSNNKVFIEKVKSMNDATFHRGPDFGQVYDLPRNVYFGHRRLSIIDRSHFGNQPMYSDCGQYCIVFNGEIYNFKELKCKIFGYCFSSNTDTEVILALVKQNGFKNAISMLDGMFSIALYDLNKGMVYLARDRSGEKPLYYYNGDKLLCFSSELTALLKANVAKFDLCKENIYEYLKYGYFLGETTPFLQVKKLLPGHILSFSLNKSEFSIAGFVGGDCERKFKSLDITYAEAMNKLDVLLQDSIEKKLYADVSVGCFLSGGIDSSLVAALASENHNQKIDTFSIGFDDASFDESYYADQVANHIGTNSHVLRLNNDFLLENAVESIDFLSEPFSNPSSIPSYILSKHAKKNVTVCLSGDGGDELFMGYNRYLPALTTFNKIKYLPSPIRYSISYLSNMLSKYDVDRLVNSIYSLLNKKGAANYSAKLQKLSKITKIQDAEQLYSFLISISDIDPYTGEKTSNALYNNYNYNFNSNYLRSAMQWDRDHYLPEDCLAKTDRMSMANSLEVRLPLISNDIIDFSNNIPLSIMHHNNQSKSLLRSILAKRVPRTLFERPKMGFTVPIRRWLTGDLNSEVRSYLTRGNIEKIGICSVPYVDNLFRSQVEQDANRLWSLYILHRWIIKNESFINI